MNARPILVMGAAVLVVSALLLILGGKKEPEPVSPPAPVTGTSAPESSAAPGAPGDRRDGLSVAAVDAGWSVGGRRSEAGARVAAVELLELTEDVVRGSPAEASVAQRAVSVAGAADRLASEVEARIRELQDQAPGGVELWVAPVAVQSTMTDDGWQVSIWYVQVLAAGPPERALASWHTVTYRLVWEQGSWRVAEVASVDGPAPTSPPVPVAVTGDQLAGILSGYHDRDLYPSADQR